MSATDAEKTVTVESEAAVKEEPERSLPVEVPAAEATVQEKSVIPIEKGDRVLRGHILDDMLHSEIEKDFLFNIFNELDDWRIRVLKYMRKVGGIFDSTRREEYFSEFITVILEKKDISELEKADLKEMIGFICGYKNVISDISICDKMYLALKKLFAAVQEGDREKVMDGLSGKYAILAHFINGSLTSENFTVKLKEIWSVQCAIIVYKNTTYAELPNASELISQWELDLVKKLLKGDEKQKLLGVQLLDANFHFKISNEDPVTYLKPVFDELMVIVSGASSRTKLEVVKLMNKIPAEAEISEDMNPHTFLVSVLTCICADIDTPESEFTQAALNLVRSRVNAPGFEGVMSALLMSDNIINGTMIICVELDLFKLYPNFVIDAFPQLVKQTRLMYTCEAVKYISKKGALTKELVKGIGSHILLMCTSPSILKKSELKKAVVDTVSYFVLSSADHIGVVIEVMMNIIEEIKEADILEEFGRSFGDIKGMADAAVEIGKLTKIFCHVFGLVSDIKTVKNVMNIFSKPVNTNEPTTVVELIGGIFENDAIPVLQKEVDARRAVNPKESTYEKLRMGILAVAIPGLSVDELNKIADDVLYADECFTFGIGVDFFTTLTIYYYEFTLDLLEKRQFGKVDGSFLVSRKKKNRQIETVRAIFNVLPGIVTSKQLDVAGQEKIWKIIEATIPVNRYEEVIEDALKLHTVFPHIKDYAPQWRVIEKLRKPEFSKDYAVFLSGVTGMDTLGVKLIRQWYKWTPYHTPELADTQALGRLIMTLPTPEQRTTTLVDSLMYVVRKQLQVTEETIPYLQLALEIVKAARALHVPYDDYLFVEFFVYICRFHTCQIPELRTLSVAIIAELFDLVSAPKTCGAEMYPGEISGVSLDLYGVLTNRATDKFIAGVMDTIIKNNKFYNYHGLILRAIFEGRDVVLTKDNIPHIHVLFAKFVGFAPVVRHHFEKGMIALSAREMEDLIPIIVKSDTAFKKILLDRILRTHDLRASFIHEYHLYMNKIPLEIKSFDTFKYIRKILATDPSSEMDDESYSRTLSELFMWLGLVHRLTPKMSIIDHNNQISAITDTLDVILAKTTVIDGSPNVEIAASTVKELGKVIDVVCHVNAQFSMSKVKAAVNSTMIMLNSPNPDFVLTAAIFFIHMLLRLYKYESKEGKALNKQMRDAIVTAFERTGTETDTQKIAENRLRIAAACEDLPNEVFSMYTKDQIVTIYNSIVEGIQCQHGTWCKHHAMMVLVRIIDLVPRDRMSHEELYKALVSVFDNHKYNDLYLNVLEVYLALHQDPSLFVTANKRSVSRLSVAGLINMINEHEDRILGILGMLARSENIVDGLKESFNEHVMAKYGLVVLEASVQPYPPSVIKFLSQIAHYVKSSEDNKCIKFSHAVIRPLLNVAEDMTSEVRETSADAVKALLLKQ